MPIYEYRCQTCGGRFEMRLSFSQADQLPECPYCHSQDTRKQVSMFASSSSGGSSSGYSSSSSCGSSGGFS